MQVKLEKNLGELFAKAREFGRVNIFTQKDGKYHCSIEFNSIEHTELQARSGFNHDTVEDAVQKALDVARSIIESFHQMANKLLT